MFVLVVLTLAQAYDYNLLEVTWRPSDCKFASCRDNYESNDFNIHGLWPNNLVGQHPSFCKDIPFDIKEDTKSQLKIYWKSFKQGDPADFWRHEWDKHGTCMNPLLSTDNYFLKTIKIYKDLDIMQKLGDKGITPSNSKQYSIQQLASAFNKKAVITCKKKGKLNLVKALHLCYDKDLNLIDCPESQRCKDDVYLPPSTN